MENPQTILIVDDEVLNIGVLKGGLGGQFRILVANSGAQAFRRLESDAVDLILLDIMMPDMDGYEICRLLKASERTRDIPVIFITARTEDEDEEKGLQMGAVDYIRKP